MGKREGEQSGKREIKVVFGCTTFYGIGLDNIFAPCLVSKIDLALNNTLFMVLNKISNIKT